MGAEEKTRLKEMIDYLESCEQWLSQENIKLGSEIGKAELLRQTREAIGAFKKELEQLG